MMLSLGAVRFRGRHVLPVLCAVALLIDSSTAMLLEVDGANLRDPRLSVSHLIMIVAPSCMECQGLRPHLETMHTKMSADGAAIMVASLNA